MCSKMSWIINKEKVNVFLWAGTGSAGTWMDMGGMIIKPAVTLSGCERRCSARCPGIGSEGLQHQHDITSSLFRLKGWRWSHRDTEPALLPRWQKCMSDTHWLRSDIHWRWIYREEMDGQGFGSSPSLFFLKKKNPLLILITEKWVVFNWM